MIAGEQQWTFFGKERGIIYHDIPAVYPDGKAGHDPGEKVKQAANFGEYSKKCQSCFNCCL